MELYQTVKWTLTIAAAALLPAMYWVPALAARRGLISWMLYGLLVLVVFVWGVTGKGNRNVSRGFDPETDNRKLDDPILWQNLDTQFDRRMDDTRGAFRT